MVGPFNASLNNKIGEITKYYLNYEFSMELKYSSSQLEKYSTQMVEGIFCNQFKDIFYMYLSIRLIFKISEVTTNTSEHTATNEFFFLWPVLSENKMYVHFYVGRHHEELISLKHETSLYLKWHKVFFF